MTLNIIRIRRENKARAEMLRDLEIKYERQMAVYEFMSQLSLKGYDFAHLTQ